MPLIRYDATGGSPDRTGSSDVVGVENGASFTLWDRPSKQDIIFKVGEHMLQI